MNSLHTFFEDLINDEERRLKLKEPSFLFPAQGRGFMGGGGDFGENLGFEGMKELGNF